MKGRVLLLANAAGAVSACLFGASVVATRVAVRAVPPLSLAVLRYAQGGLILLIFLLLAARGLLHVERHDLPFLVLLGAILFAAFPLTFNIGLRFTEASRGSLMLATSPLWTAALARATRREQLTARQLLGLLLTFTGVAAVLIERGVNWRGSGRALLGDGLLLITALCGAAYSVLAKRALARYSPLTVTMYGMIFGTLLLSPAALVEGLIPSLSRLHGRTLLLVLFLGVLGGAVAWYLSAFALRRLLPTQTAVYINLNPLIATILGAVLLGEHLTLIFALGFAVVLGGVVLVNWPASARRGPEGDVRLQASA